MIVFGGEGGAGVDLAPLFRPNVSTNPPSLHGTSSIRGSLHFRGHVAAGSVSLSHSSAAAPALSRVRVQDTFVRSFVWFVRFWCPPVSRISSWTSSRPGTAVEGKGSLRRWPTSDHRRRLHDPVVFRFSTMDRRLAVDHHPVT